MNRTDTEATCEVVRVKEILNHGNADRLSVVKFEFEDGTVPDYQVITGKGDFKEGDLAIYISDDMLVPVQTAIRETYPAGTTPPPVRYQNNPFFGFLQNRKDYKYENRDGYYRIRAAKLRGEISTGLLIPLSTDTYSMLPRLVPLGKDVAEQLGVVKYESPADKAAAEHALYAGPPKGRIDRLKRWLVKKLFKLSVPPEYGVTALRKVPHYFKPGEQVLYTEKVHGANMRFGKIRGKVYIGSHRSEKSDRRNWLVRGLFRDKRGPGWYGKDLWSEWFYRTFNTKARLNELPNNIIFYGELYGPGIQKNFDYGLTETAVFVYDAYDMKAKRWLSYAELWNEVPSFITVVKTHLVEDFTWADLLEAVERDSEMGAPGRKNTIKEGIVVRSTDWERAGKYVSKRYLESER